MFFVRDKFFKTLKKEGGQIMKEFLKWLILGEGGFPPLCSLIYGVAFVMIGQVRFGDPIRWYNICEIGCGIFMFLIFIAQVLSYRHSRLCRC